MALSRSLQPSLQCLRQRSFLRQFSSSLPLLQYGNGNGDSVRTHYYQPKAEFQSGMVPVLPALEQMPDRDNVGATPEHVWKTHAKSVYDSTKDISPPTAYSGWELFACLLMPLTLFFSLGRTVRVRSNIMDSYAMLSNLLQRNNVRRELGKASRHEKKGVKRRRLASETWRRVFAHEARTLYHLRLLMANLFTGPEFCPTRCQNSQSWSLMMCVSNNVNVSIFFLCDSSFYASTHARLLGLFNSCVFPRHVSLPILI